MKETLLLQHVDLTYVTTPQSVAAEQEVLDEVIAFLLREYPSRFAVVAPAAGGCSEVVETLSEGYRRRFALADWAVQPLVLVGAWSEL